MLYSSDVLSITDKPRIGISIESGVCLGSVFMDFDKILKDSRPTIDLLLKEIDSRFEKLITYSFLDRNCWPLSVTQEEQLEVMDILSNQNITIRPKATCNQPNGQSNLITMHTSPIVQFPTDPETDRPQMSLPNLQENGDLFHNNNLLADDSNPESWKRKSKKGIM